MLLTLPAYGQITGFALYGVAKQKTAHLFPEMRRLGKNQSFSGSPATPPQGPVALRHRVAPVLRLSQMKKIKLY